MNGYVRFTSHASRRSIMQSIENVLVVGAGWVGRQIAARFAQHGVSVWLLDRDQRVCDDALAWIAALDGAVTWLDRVRCSPPLQELAAPKDGTPPRVDLAIESIPEQLSLKKRVLREVSRALPPPTIIASNSSYFVPSMLGQFVDHPERFAHLHFHVPVLHDSVVDIVGGPETSAAVIEALRQAVIRVGQDPLVLRKEHPGYVFNWLLQAVLRAALELAALDVADPPDIDRAWKSVTGMPLGPFGIMDRIGLDVTEQVLSNARWAAPSEADIDQLLTLLGEYTRRGDLGVKSGQGFYPYG